MNQFTIILAICLSFSSLNLAIASTEQTAKETITIYTGVPRGAYFQIGNDIRRACPNFNIQVVETKGSLDNISASTSPQPMRTGHSFALVQSDILTGSSGSQVRAGVNVVMPLYQEIITVLANRSSNILGVRDLEGKSVAVGVRGSGTWFTSSAIKSTIGINWVQIEKPHAESILALLVGDIDAIIMVAGHPLASYVELPKSIKNVITFVPLTDHRLYTQYSHITLPGTYIWQEKALDTISTQALLVSSKKFQLA